MPTITLSTTGPDLTGLLPTSQPEPNILPELQPQAHSTFRIYQPQTVGHNVLAPELPNYTSTYPVEDNHELSWPTESELQGLAAFAANFVDDGMTSVSHSNFTSQDSGNQARVMQVGPSFTSSSASEARSNKKRQATSDIFVVDGTAKKAKRPCYKCGQDTCRGTKRKNKCENPCRDCNQLNCEGRSTAQPDLPCGGATWSLLS